MSDVPSPHTRIGDQEREHAVQALGEHLSAGRLTVDEYGERSASAAVARTRGDLLSLFADLPEPRPHFAVPPATSAAARPVRARSPLPVLPLVAGAVLVIVALAVLRLPVPLIVLAVVLVSVAGRNFGSGATRHRGRRGRGRRDGRGRGSTSGGGTDD
ncbi:DUF1707 SHOCT-like domain-containing protein [Goodfellowiella coeruleoviolacea]|uniref:DUF1707 SHOCT-like domain-containing protein n=1 Tax=Goodfellowiella coeruleoviolacea TaxID=334858 RepID=UPI0020A2B67F|nr:DUF1707 domain-containing protein [Goodfellowiella coeruleoviolacea]